MSADPDLSYIAEDLRQFAVPIDSVILDPKNARTHGEENLAAIGSSISAFQQRKPITVTRSTRIVSAGNGTLARARELGWTHIAALFFDDDEAQAAAWAVADNRTAELATWDYRQLAETMAHYPEVDWQAVGYAPDELEAILAAAAPVPEIEDVPTTTVSEHEREIGGEPIDDDALPEEIQSRTAVGDVVDLADARLHCCDCMDLLRSLPDNSIDAIVTDAPYGLSADRRARTWDDLAEGAAASGGLLGHTWDAAVPGVSWARECLRVLKPGGHIVVHSATRTVHRLACALEDAGFEIRDLISWIHYQGWPKSHNVGDGLGTALKPALEPAVLARKPISERSVEANIARWGTGALQIDACRIAFGDDAWPGPSDNEHLRGKICNRTADRSASVSVALPAKPTQFFDERGRWPANIYYCPKPGEAERLVDGEAAAHPTIKPIKLYRWLLRLVVPPGGVVLEPFAGSGTTLLAARREGLRVIAAEMEPAYCDIIRARLS